MTKEAVIKELTKIKGVTKAKAEHIYNNGFDSIEKIKKAKISDLEKIDGVTNTLAKNILKQLHAKVEVKKIKTKKTEKDKEKQKKVEKKKDLPKEKTVIEKQEIKEEKIKEEEIKKEQEKVEPEPASEKKVEYKFKKKPKLDKELKEKLVIRKKIKAKKPKFLREEWFRYVKIPKNWRKPDGLTSKMRLHKKYRPSVVRVGFRSPRETRGLHSSGFEEVFVFNVNDLLKINPDKQAARIGGSVGTKKRLEIQKKAQELDIRILNL